MSEFFLELFSEEIPSRLQINARNELAQIFKKFFDDNEIIVKGKINTYSTPNRLIVHINNISKDINYLYFNNLYTHHILFVYCQLILPQIMVFLIF